MRKAVLVSCLVLALGVSGNLPTGAVVQEKPDGPPPDSSFQKVTLNDRPGEPMSLAVLPDGRVLHAARTGQLRIYDPKTGLNTLAAELDVYQHDEEGLQSVAIDRDFKRNKWVYLYYSPPLDTPVDDPDTPTVNEGDAPFFGTEADFAPFRGLIRLSRFKLRGNSLDLSSEQEIMDVPVDRGICCHVGGNIDFDKRGNLYLSTGDDTNPFESDGYTPIDDRPDRHPAFDAQRSAANTNDLRGKLLRIRVKNSGDYEIPKGNLFRPGTPKTRPEIYVMGLRNPFRFAIGPETDDVYLADYSPDADEADPLRGPAGQGKWAIITKSANYGWPYCSTAELPYVDYDFATEQSGETFSCARPVNESPHNTGLRQLPKVRQPEVWYSYGVSPEFPELGEGGIGPMGGPAYDFDRKSKSRLKWPEYFDGAPLFYEWTRDYVKEFRLDRRGRLDEINPVLPSHIFDNPMDMEFGPDGALYVLEYGDGFFAENPEAQLARFDFVRGNFTPVPAVSADVTIGLPPLTVAFSSEGTSDPDGDRLKYEWDFDADGKVDSKEPNPTYTYEENGAFDATLKVTDTTGRSAAASVMIIVGNIEPVVELTTSPAPGEPFQFGQAVTYTVTVTDDTPVDCSEVRVTYILGHADHGHPLTTSAGCTGTIQTFVDSGHAGASNLRAVFSASYTDAPTDPSVPPLSDDDEVILTPGG